MRYQAWIDVGGTFTDCYFVDQEQPLLRRRLKTLSSGLVPVSIQGWAGSSVEVMARELIGDVDQFWAEAQLRCYDAQRCIVRAPRVIAFEGATGRLSLAEPIPESAVSFELDAGLEAPVLAVRRGLNCPLSSPLPPIGVRLGTTRGTNALLTRRGAKVALAITRSLEDLLLIGDQTRPQLFELAIKRDESLAALSIGIEERLDANGQVLTQLDTARARAALEQALEAGCESLAICLMHSYRNPTHEEQLEQLAREVGFVHISRSSGLAPLIEIVARARTTVVDAYLGPIVRSYLQKLFQQFGGQPDTRLEIMTSAGGLVDWQGMAGKDSILSGPAGGVVALRALAQASGFPHLIGLDMGGTSTDTARTAPDQGLQYESTKAGVRILTPTLPIETVASGGGSICWFDGVSLRVGPQSAGAMPGPACYGRGGPLTITDLNVYLGRLPASQFPFPLDLPAIECRLEELNAQLSQVNSGFDSLSLLAEGLRRIAAQQMAEAVRTVSIAQGADPRQHVLAGFGGAAGQHICEIAELLGIERILHTQEAGLLSALGMGLASQRRDQAVPLYQLLDQVDLVDVYQQASLTMGKLAEDWITEGQAVDSAVGLEMRYQGTDVTLTIPTGGSATRDELTAGFHAAHLARFGYDRRNRAIEVVAARLEVTLPSQPDWPAIQWAEPAAGVPLTLPTEHRLIRQGQVEAAAHVSHAALTGGTRVNGPTVVLSPGSTLVVDAGWTVLAGSDGTLLLSRQSHALPSPAISSVTQGEAVDPVAQAVFAQRLAAITTQMGLVLQQTALSVNVKQRRDFSCALFDSHGRMLASAPHVPVHLGAMGATVRAAMQAHRDWRPGDVVVTNNPYAGGSHLPDITVISAVFDAASGRPAMFVANRAHHADIGGVAPGSMSVTATRLGDEGAIIAMLKLSADQCGELEPLRGWLASAPWPPRNIDENLADLRAQLAANRRGEQLLQEIAERLGWPAMASLGQAVLQIAERRVRNFIASLPDHKRSFEDWLDDGTRIAVTISQPSDQRLVIDFTGTGPVSRANFNANPSIVTAAVIYVLRCLIADDLPLNEGMLAAIDLVIPESVLNPKPAANLADSPAVAAGNVETSQRVVDCLLGAFGVAAASQGTMNNLLFGNQRFGFYETICGGAGATAQAAGASGVHTHMTNTRLTDPEILEARYPARLLHFGLRSGSGGQGRTCGGEGVIRRIQFLEPVSVSLLTSRRGAVRPYGLCGGSPGAAGRNIKIDVAGNRSDLPPACQIEFSSGEAIELQTPGGGGYGAQAT